MNVTSLTVSLVSKRYMRGVVELKFSRLFVKISTIALVCLVLFGEENGEIIDVCVKFKISKKDYSCHGRYKGIDIVFSLFSLLTS